MNFKMGNLTSRNFIMKLVELVRLDLANKEIMRKSSSQVMSLIVLLVFRLGSSGDMIIWGSGPEWAKYRSFHPLKNNLCLPRIMQYPNPPGVPGSYPERSENDLILGLLVSPGYFFITLVLLVGLALGDESEYGVKLKLSNHSRFFYICWCLSARHVYINGLPLRCVSSTCSASYSTSAREQSRSLQQEMPRQTEPWSVF